MGGFLDILVIYFTINFCGSIQYRTVNECEQLEQNRVENTFMTKAGAFMTVAWIGHGPYIIPKIYFCNLVSKGVEQ